MKTRYLLPMASLLFALSQGALAWNWAYQQTPNGMHQYRSGSAYSSSFSVQQVMLPNAYGVRIYTSGQAAKNLSIRAEKGRLLIQTREETRKTLPGGGFISMGSFSQSFGLPPDADTANMKINRNGNVIEVMIPRKRRTR